MADRNKVRYVAIDMWNPYREAVRQLLSHATIIVDKFHVLRQANQVVEVTRKSLRASLTPKRCRTLVRHVHGDSSGVRGAAQLWSPQET